MHRSWWVARQAAKQLKREDGKQVPELNTGGLIPVSRGRSAAIREWMNTISHEAQTKKDPA